ncbi:DUF305 domain-containing protein [Streptomyces avicenniae]|uniref:DUF305 domain-containing protein n=1 Tax=Streptomyces avicenniae TaxID=500153 RepID=UPI00069BCFB3|nr:DUF305 domain-containing protein [Streptomyces avicenniae]
MTTAATARALAGTLLAAVLLAGCGGGSDGGGDDAEGPVTTDPATEPPAASPSAAPSATVPAEDRALNFTDLAWVQLMIPLTDQVRPLLDLVEERAADPAFGTFATDLAAAGEEDLAALHALLEADGVPYENVHAGHNMPGMVTEEELAAVTAAEGDAFEEQARAHIREFLEHTVTVSTGEQDAGQAPEAVALAADLDTAATEQLDTLTALGG